MSIDLQLITQLRQLSGAGLGDCKKALEEASGDITLAIEILRKKGEIKAAKKSDRSATEGVVAIAQSAGKASGVVLLCETDFVARNPDFVAATQVLAQELLQKDLATFAADAQQKITSELVVKIGEHIKLGDHVVTDGAVIGSYVHSNRKVGAIVALSGGDESLASDIAMHISAMSPSYIDAAAVPVDVIAKEKEIYQEQLRAEGKPEAIWEKIIEGKLKKFYEENCLVDQIFVKDDSVKISDLLKAAGAELTSFHRLSV